MSSDSTLHSGDSVIGKSIFVMARKKRNEDAHSKDNSGCYYNLTNIHIKRDLHWRKLSDGIIKTHACMLLLFYKILGSNSPDEPDQL